MEVEGSHMASEMQQKFKSKIMESTILDSFTKLSAESDRERIKGGTLLLKHLSQSQDNEKNDIELKYALDRLIKGSGSSRINARKGFFAALVALLSTSTITTTEVLETIKKQLQTCGSNSKSEKADIHTGRILVSGALLRSNVFSKGTQEEQIQIVQLLVEAGKQRSFLSLATYTFLAGLLENIDETTFVSVLWPLVKPEVAKPWSEQTLDTMWFLLLAREKYPNVVKSKFIKKNLGAPEILHEESMESLCTILMNTPMLKSIQHPLYRIICNHISKSEYINEFSAAVNTQLNKFTRNKLIIATTMVTYIMESLDNLSDLPVLLLPRLMQEIVKILPIIKHKKEDDVYVTTTTLLNLLSKKLSDKEVKAKIKIAVLRKLLFHPGHFLFEKITGTKTIQLITANLNSEGVKKLTKIYKEIVQATKNKSKGDDLTEPWLNTERLYAAHLLNKLLAHPSIYSDSEWRLEQIKFLFELNFLASEDSNIGIDLAGQLKASFYRALDLKLPKLEDLRALLSSLIHHIDTIISVKSSRDLLRDTLTEDGIKNWQEMIQLVNKLETQQNKIKESYAIPIFHTLLMHMGLQLFSDVKLAQSTLQDLQSCFSRIESEQKSRKELLVEGCDENEEPLWTEVLVDLFLSLLSQNTHLYRSVVSCVFPYLCPHLTATGVHQILNVLDPQNDTNPLLDRESDSDDSDSDDDENVDEEEDEIISENAESEDSDTDDQIEEDEQETVNDKLRMAVREALGGSGTQTDDESVDMDDMDEDESKRLDKALAQAFKKVKGNVGKKSKKQNKDERALTHFRVRVVDLIEMFLDSEPSMAIVIEIMLPLLQTLEFSIRDVHQQPLENRVRGCLKKLSGMKKFSSVDNVNETSLVDLMKSLLEKGDKSTSIFQDMGDKITECCVFILRCSLLISAKQQTTTKMSAMNKLICNCLKMFFQKRDCLIPSILFKNVLQLSWNGNLQLAPLLVEFAFDSSIRPYRRNQALELLITLYRNHRFMVTAITESKSVVDKIETKFGTNTITFFENIASNPKKSGVKEKFVCLLMTLLQTAVHFHTQIKIESQMDSKRIGNAIRSYRSSVTLAKDAKKAYNKLCNILGISQNTVAKKKIVVQNERQRNGIHNDDSSNTDDEIADQHSKLEYNPDEKISNKKRQKIRAMKKDKQQLKKEAKLLRMGAMEGLDEGTFSNLPNGVFLHDENSSMETENTPQQKRKRPLDSSEAIHEIAESDTPLRKKNRHHKSVNLNGT